MLCNTCFRLLVDNFRSLQGTFFSRNFLPPRLIITLSTDWPRHWSAQLVLDYSSPADGDADFNRFRKLSSRTELFPTKFDRRLNSDCLWCEFIPPQSLSPTGSLSFHNIRLSKVESNTLLEATISSNLRRSVHIQSSDGDVRQVFRHKCSLRQSHVFARKWETVLVRNHHWLQN